MDLYSVEGEMGAQECQEFLHRLRVKGSVDQVHTQHAQGFLLLDIGVIAHVHMQDDVVCLRAGRGLKAQLLQAADERSGQRHGWSNRMGKHGHTQNRHEERQRLE